MRIDLIRGSHSVGETNLHLQLTPAYRCGIFADELLRILVRDYFLAQARRKGFSITAIGFGDDHVHLFVVEWKNYSPAKLAQLLKGFVSRMMRKHHYELFRMHLYGRKFWTAGYFYRTVGAVNASTVKRYVAESQEYEGSGLSNQSKLIEFSA
jgi:REP element-mobilizing transposase RayT